MKLPIEMKDIYSRYKKFCVIYFLGFWTSIHRYQGQEIQSVLAKLSTRRQHNSNFTSQNEKFAKKVWKHALKTKKMMNLWNNVSQLQLTFYIVTELIFFTYNYLLVLLKNKNGFRLNFQIRYNRERLSTGVKCLPNKGKFRYSSSNLKWINVHTETVPDLP